jgi:hypothetical protein
MTPVREKDRWKNPSAQDLSVLLMLEPREDGHIGPVGNPKIRSKDLEEKATLDLPWKQLSLRG